MAYTEEDKEKIFNAIITEIADKGRSVRSILRDEGMPVASTFFKWLSDDVSKSNQYARACEVRAELIFDELIEIVDDTSSDYIDVKLEKGSESEILLDKKPNYEVIQRSRLRFDARRWMLSKMIPKKYGDKIDLTTDGEKLSGSIPLVLEDGRSLGEVMKELKTDEEE